ncbi:MAG TPA: hypothetical protein VFE47_29195 [Tepidisphaeraceae bacterium]|jgi:hypothetical protein|nr:hypothetical protein [Tepidisphaeraceae bacterium]
MTDSNITDLHPAFLSPLTQSILNKQPAAYRKLVVTGGTPTTARELLADVKPEQLLTVPVKSRHDASAMLGGLWLRHDALHECHEIVQDLIGPTGSFWHAIMHRREGDFSNAKYWYARCADHRAFRLVSALARDVIGREVTDKSLLQIAGAEYNPDALVDLVAELQDKPQDPRLEAAVQLQRMEWEALFHYCAYEAAGESGGMI